MTERSHILPSMTFIHTWWPSLPTDGARVSRTWKGYWQRAA